MVWSVAPLEIDKFQLECAVKGVEVVGMSLSVACVCVYVCVYVYPYVYDYDYGDGDVVVYAGNGC